MYKQVERTSQENSLMNVGLKHSMLGQFKIDQCYSRRAKSFGQTSSDSGMGATVTDIQQSGTKGQVGDVLTRKVNASVRATPPCLGIQQGRLSPFTRAISVM